jgi:hypothetical protein
MELWQYTAKDLPGHQKSVLINDISGRMRNDESLPLCYVCLGTLGLFV